MSGRASSWQETVRRRFPGCGALILHATCVYPGEEILQYDDPPATKSKQDPRGGREEGREGAREGGGVPGGGARLERTEKGTPTPQLVPPETTT